MWLLLGGTSENLIFTFATCSSNTVLHLWHDIVRVMDVFYPILTKAWTLHSSPNTHDPSSPKMKKGLSASNSISLRRCLKYCCSALYNHFSLNVYLMSLILCRVVTLLKSRKILMHKLMYCSFHAKCYVLYSCLLERFSLYFSLRYYIDL